VAVAVGLQQVHQVVVVATAPDPEDVDVLAGDVVSLEQVEIFDVLSSKCYADVLGSVEVSRQRCDTLFNARWHGNTLSRRR